MYNLILLPLLIFFLAQNVEPWHGHQQPLSSKMSFSISSERTGYFINEPVKLKLTLKNESTNELVGFFSPALILRNLDIYYRKQGTQEFIKYHCQKQDQNRNALMLPSPLASKDIVERQETIIFDTGKKRFVLSESGIYEFKAVYRDYANEPNAQLESDLIYVQVLPVPESEIEALRLYNNEGIAKLIQSDGDYDPAEVVKRLAELLDQFPESIYAKHVNTKIIPWLRGRMQNNLSTDFEKRF